MIWGVFSGNSTHAWPFSKSKINLKSDRVNIVAPAIPIECLLYLPNVLLGNSNVPQTTAARDRVWRNKTIDLKIKELTGVGWWMRGRNGMK